MTDITYVYTWQGWLYLAVVLDLSRKVVGSAVAPTIRRELVLDAVRAIRARRPPGTLIYPDQGSQLAVARGDDSVAPAALSQA